MFESLVAAKKITNHKDRRRELCLRRLSLKNTNHVAIEGLFGGLFKSKEQKSKEEYEKILQEMSAQITKAKTQLTNCIAQITQYMNDYLGSLHESSEKIQGKKFSNLKFSTLTTTGITYKYPILTAGLYRIAGVKLALQLLVNTATSEKYLSETQKTPFGKLEWLINEKDLHYSNPAFAIEYGHLCTMADAADLGNLVGPAHAALYECVDAGESLSAIGYTSSFVNETISRSNSVVMNVKALFVFHNEFEQFCNRAEEVSHKTENHILIHNYMTIISFIHECITDSLYMVGDEYPKHASALVRHIVSHCYE